MFGTQVDVPSRQTVSLAICPSIAQAPLGISTLASTTALFENVELLLVVEAAGL